jgi:vacuolar iron transporter family protein
MPQTPHVEKHFTASETVRDIVIGMADGLTVPFALAAGLSGAVEATGISTSRCSTSRAGR